MMLNRPTGVLIIALVIATACATTAAPRWKLARVPYVRIWSAGFEQKKVVDDPAEIKNLLACLGRAKRISQPASHRQWSHSIDIGEYGRWLYDDASGKYQVLSKAVVPVYQLDESDRRLMRKFLK